MKFLISISYDGSKFYGFQRLNNKETVQKKIEEALSIINKSPVEIKGAGRTDRGVHAIDQKASFTLNVNIDEGGLKDALNSLVKPYIFITDVKKVDKSFHARFNVLEKEYIYKMNLGEYNPLLEDYTYQPLLKLNIKKMKQVAKIFTGAHNFKNFVSGERNNNDAIIKSIKFIRKENILEIHFIGKSFYRYMVRNLVGAMLDASRNRVSVKEIEEGLNNPEKEVQFSTASPNGLYLYKIKY